MGQTIGSSWAKSESQHNLANGRFAAKSGLSNYEHPIKKHMVDQIQPPRSQRRRERASDSQYRAAIGDYQPKPEPALPLYSHCRVSSSVHPGTANRGAGAVTPWTGRK
jgi:hypothetical protein